MIKIKNKKAAFQISKLLIGLGLFTLFVVFLGAAYYNMASTYGVPVSDKYSSSYNKIGEISNKSISIGEQLQGGNLQETNTLIIAAQSVFSVGQIGFDALALPILLINQVFIDSVIPIPRIFQITLITILVITVGYTIGSLFARWVM